MNSGVLKKMILPNELAEILKKTKANIIVPKSREQLITLTLGGEDRMSQDIIYEIPGGDPIHEGTAVRCKNGIVVNFTEPYMRRRDPDCTVIADDLPTDKTTHKERFGKEFAPIRLETFQWLSEQKDLIVMPFIAGKGKEFGYPSLLVAPANAAFFAMAMADLQGFVPADKVPNSFKPKAVVYVAPTFRNTHYDGKQVVVHNRLFDMHEVFSFNLYPGPSAKKGIYGVLLNIGEQEKWVTLHASTVKMETPYELTFTIAHEGASGGGKSEMIESFQREPDGRILLGTNKITNEKFFLPIADASEVHPVTDDMAAAHPGLQKSKKLTVVDAENGWFLRVNHITKYGTQPEVERITIHPPKPLLFLNIDASPGSTALLWEPIEDAPGKPCSNPRVILPRHFVPNHVDKPIEVNVRSFGIRTPMSSREHPGYGIAGIFHVLPPALAWLWRLTAPRGHDNPSITDTVGMTSEGVGSYWPFATGKKVTQANLLLDLILKTPSTRYILIPNQHIGVYQVGFAGQWITREYISRRGGLQFKSDALMESRCPLLGYNLVSFKVDGNYIPKRLLQVNRQAEVGDDGYDAGAKILTEFFHRELPQYLTSELDPLGRKIIEACLSNASVKEYYDLIPKL